MTARKSTHLIASTCQGQKRTALTAQDLESSSQEEEETSRSDRDDDDSMETTDSEDDTDETNASRSDSSIESDATTMQDDSDSGPGRAPAVPLDRRPPGVERSSPFPLLRQATASSSSSGVSTFAPRPWNPRRTSQPSSAGSTRSSSTFAPDLPDPRDLHASTSVRRSSSIGTVLKKVESPNRNDSSSFVVGFDTGLFGATLEQDESFFSIRRAGLGAEPLVSPPSRTTTVQQDELTFAQARPTLLPSSQASSSGTLREVWTERSRRSHDTTRFEHQDTDMSNVEHGDEASKQMVLRTRTAAGTALVPGADRALTNSIEARKSGKKTNEKRRDGKAKVGRRKQVEVGEWYKLVEVALDSGRPIVPDSYRARSEWMLDHDLEDAVDEVVPQELLVTIEGVVFDSAKVSQVDSSKIKLLMSLVVGSSQDGEVISTTVFEASYPCPFDCQDVSPSNPRGETLVPSPGQASSDKPYRIPLDLELYRSLRATSIKLVLTLQIGSTLFETRRTLMSSLSSNSPNGRHDLFPSPWSGTLPFEPPDHGSGLSIALDVREARSLEPEAEVLRRLETMREERDRVWVPDAPSVRPTDRSHRRSNAKRNRGEKTMPDLGQERLGYDFFTKVPYRPGDVVRDFWGETAENAAATIRENDETIERSSSSPAHKLIARAHMRWGLANPFAPTVFDRERACWFFYAPLVLHFDLRFELCLFLVRRSLGRGLITEGELCGILRTYDGEARRVRQGQRKGYEALRREAMWAKEHGK
ncbi:hypothetical protein JCM10212_002477 [Sporobolomyces blumeae]